MAVVRSSAGADTAGPLVFIEVEEDPEARSAWSDDLVLGPNPAERVVVATRDMLSDSVELARTCAARFSRGLQNLPDGIQPPDEVVLELGIKLDAELGAVLAKARSSAQLKVTVTWRNED